MSISGIGATGYPAAGYEIRRTARNIAGKNFSGQMGNVKSTQGTGIMLYISNPEDGEAIGSIPNKPQRTGRAVPTTMK